MDTLITPEFHCVDVLDYKYEGLVALANRTNKNLERRGYSERVEIGEPTYIVKNVFVLTDDGPIERPARFARVFIKGAFQAHGGATMLAAVDHLDDTNMILCAHPEAEAKMGEDYFQNLRTVRPTCDHCGVNRDRNQTVVVEKDGELVRVGKSCLEAYLGCPAAQALFRFAQAVIDAREVPAESDFWSSGKTTGYAPEDIIACTLKVTENGTWYHKDEVRHGVLELLQPKNAGWFKDAPFEKANEIVEWAKTTFDGKNSYTSNVLAILNAEWCRPKYIGFIIGLVPSYFRAMRVKVEKAARLNEYFGSVGDKVKLVLTHVSSYGYDTQYGYSYIHILRDEEGRTFKWQTGKALYNELAERTAESGDKLDFRGTIKAHSEYKETKQTVLTRCKFDFLPSVDEASDDLSKASDEDLIRIERRYKRQPETFSQEAYDAIEERHEQLIVNVVTPEGVVDNDSYRRLHEWWKNRELFRGDIALHLDCLILETCRIQELCDDDFRYLLNDKDFWSYAGVFSGLPKKVKAELQRRLDAGPTDFFKKVFQAQLDRAAEAGR